MIFAMLNMKQLNMAAGDTDFGTLPLCPGVCQEALDSQPVYNLPSGDNTTVIPDVTSQLKGRVSPEKGMCHGLHGCHTPRIHSIPTHCMKNTSTRSHIHVSLWLSSTQSIRSYIVNK